MSEGNGTKAVAPRETEDRPFQGTMDIQARGSDVGALAAVGREEAGIQAAFVVAKRFPRDEDRAYTRVMQSCKRPRFADGAEYSFPRGGASVSGPSVKLARELARLWGNLRYGIRLVAVDDDTVHGMGWALDCETNTQVESEFKIRKLVQRKRFNGDSSPDELGETSGKNKWVKPDERDLRELINKHGAIAVRNALLQLLPPDIVEDALSESRRTQRDDVHSQPMEDVVRKLLIAFEGKGVDKSMIEGLLRHKLSLVTEEELVELRRVFNSIKDGNSTREDHFDVSMADDPKSRYAPIDPNASRENSQNPGNQAADVEVQDRAAEPEKQEAEPETEVQHQDEHHDDAGDLLGTDDEQTGDFF